MMCSQELDLNLTEAAWVRLIVFILMPRGLKVNCFQYLFEFDGKDVCNKPTTYILRIVSSNHFRYLFFRLWLQYLWQVLRHSWLTAWFLKELKPLRYERHWNIIQSIICCLLYEYLLRIIPNMFPYGLLPLFLSNCRFLEN